MVPLLFASPHSGNDYPVDFVAGSRLDPVALRRSEDAFVDDLFTAAAEYGAPLLRALFPRAFIDANREPFELDQGMFSDRLPDYVNTESSRVAAGLGTIAKVVSGGQNLPREAYILGGHRAHRFLLQAISQSSRNPDCRDQA